jgi:hypothetical protein
VPSAGKHVQVRAEHPVVDPAFDSDLLVRSHGGPPAPSLLPPDCGGSGRPGFVAEDSW